VVEAGLAAADAAAVSGKEITPFLLDWVQRETGGASLEANVTLVLRNASLAARIAGAAA
jgi:pseudouridine-5'-phosphate glycosidase